MIAGIQFIGSMLITLFNFQILDIKFGTLIVGFATGSILFFAVKKLF